MFFKKINQTLHVYFIILINYYSKLAKNEQLTIVSLFNWMQLFRYAYHYSKVNWYCFLIFPKGILHIINKDIYFPSFHYVIMSLSKKLITIYLINAIKKSKQSSIEMFVDWRWYITLTLEEIMINWFGVSIEHLVMKAESEKLLSFGWYILEHL